ncbi:MAG: hypothetical protein ACREBV_06905, partial [Candidatus Zixiibacteriota bacterium]
MTPENFHKRVKGSFSEALLSVSKKYVYPAKYRKTILVGVMAAIVVIVYFVVDWLVLSGKFATPGPVSSNHADFEGDCEKCHDLANEVSDKNCSSCHEKFGDDLGVYTFKAHYLYRSDNYARIQPASEKSHSDEQNCYECHQEHNGRMAQITSVPDTKCLKCHDYGSFDSDHPEFQFVRERIPDDSALKFTHIRHTGFVSKFLEQKGERAYIEETCLYCHNAKDDGKNFQPLDFDKHCKSCHLTASVETPLLDVEGGTADEPGVETLEMIRRRLGPGTRWAFYLNPNEFTSLGGRKVKKAPVYHEDPWILENLKQIRNQLYVSTGLDAILNTVPNPQKPNPRGRNQEVIEALKEYADQLRGRPEAEIQQDLLIIDSLISMAERRSRAELRLLSSKNMNLQPQFNPNLSQNQIDGLVQVANDLTGAGSKLCQECHSLSNAGIVSFNGDQRSLVRAEFDHRAHILERQCLDCHNIIPVTSEMNPNESARKALDISATHN